MSLAAPPLLAPPVMAELPDEPAPLPPVTVTPAASGHVIELSGRQLLVDGQPLQLRGVCWNPVPVGAVHPEGLDFAGFAALDFAAGFGLEAAVAAFGLAVLGLDGALAMDSPTPRWLMLAMESTPARVSIRNDSGV